MSPRTPPDPAPAPSGLRIGHGYDAHRLVAGRRLILGGVAIPCERGLLGHSDADVVIHAVCDALLGAMALGDIGRHFPDDQSAYQDMDSRVLLARIVALLREQKRFAVNVDITVLAEAPKLGPYLAQMCANLAADLGIAQDCINIKASTTEGMGAIGRGEGIAAHALVLLGAC